MSDTRLEEYHKDEETLRVLAQAAHESYITASKEYDDHRQRLTTLHSGSNTRVYLDGQEITSQKGR